MDGIKKARERRVRFQASAEQHSEEGWPRGRPSSFLAFVGIGLLGFLKQFIGQRSRRATLDLFDDRGRGSAVYVYPRLP
jgi:hypothetical protein